MSCDIGEAIGSSNPSAASPTSQLILQPFFRFSYATGFYLRHLANRPGKDAGRPRLLNLLKGGLNEMKRNDWDEHGEMLDLNLW